MSQVAPSSRRPRKVLLLGLAGLLVGSAGCTTPGQDLDLRVKPAPVIRPKVQVGAEVGRLLSPQPEVSQAAERRLVALTGEELTAFLTYVETLEGERDVRLLNVLDEHHALPEMPVPEQIEFLLWKASRPERFYAMKAQSRLIDLARRDPAPLLARLDAGGANVDVLGVVLAITRTQEAVPVLLRRYRSTTEGRARSATAEALGMIAGEERRPRPSGRPEDIERDAAAIEAWYEEQQLMKQDAAAGGTR